MIHRIDQGIVRDVARYAPRKVMAICFSIQTRPASRNDAKPVCTDWGMGAVKVARMETENSQSLARFITKTRSFGLALDRSAIYCLESLVRGINSVPPSWAFQTLSGPWQQRIQIESKGAGTPRGYLSISTQRLSVKNNLSLLKIVGKNILNRFYA